jgi:hypothetical protein
MNDQNRVAVATKRYPGRIYVWLGILVALAGVAVYFIQFNAKILRTPWYTPICATIGVGLVLLALVYSRTIWRWAALVFLTLLAAAEWHMVLQGLSTPTYAGPVQAGQPFPEFATTLADGSTFTQRDLKGEQNTVMVFFRGHW